MTRLISHKWLTSPAIVTAIFLALSGLLHSQEGITSVRHTGADVEIKFKGATGTIYRLQESPGLVSALWNNTGPEIPANGSEQIVRLTGAGQSPRRFFRLVVVPATIPGFAYIPGGTFLLGDQSPGAEGVSNERPVVQVALGGFHIMTTEVTKDQWDATKTYASANGYTFSSNAGTGKAGNHPVYSANWYDIIKWCNAKSEQDGLEPCYFLPGLTTIYKTGSPSKIVWSFTRNGYRLPAEAEWEKAARGGVTGSRFPWGATVSHTQANYKASANYSYDVSGATGFHPTYNDGVVPFTAPVNSFATNGHGLHNMGGNVREYCWDRIREDYTAGYVIDPESASSLFPRVVRGGDWSTEATGLRCSYRGSLFPDTGKNNYTGFRLARGRLN